MHYIFSTLILLLSFREQFRLILHKFQQNLHTREQKNNKIYKNIVLCVKNFFRLFFLRARMIQKKLKSEIYLRFTFDFLKKIEIFLKLKKKLLDKR